nr:hypothetical protein GCM10020092_045820 [Actinoplanes digitatis]
MTTRGGAGGSAFLSTRGVSGGAALLITRGAAGGVARLLTRGPSPGVPVSVGRSPTCGPAAAAAGCSDHGSGRVPGRDAAGRSGRAVRGSPPGWTGAGRGGWPGRTGGRRSCPGPKAAGAS